MSPIRPSQQGCYPNDWTAISKRIRFERARGRCECEGECGGGHDERCSARNGFFHPRTGAAVILTVAHLNHFPEDNRDENLRALCQGCHLHYDREHHAETRRRAHNLDLFEGAAS